MSTSGQSGWAEGQPTSAAATGLRGALAPFWAPESPCSGDGEASQSEAPWKARREKRWREFDSFQSRAPLNISQETAGAITWRFPSQQAPSMHVFTSKVPPGGALSYAAGCIDWVPPQGSRLAGMADRR